jgi:hypothetical protein
MERRPDIVRIDDFGVARPVDRGAVQRFKGAKGTYRLLPSPPRFVLLEKHAEGTNDFLRLRLGGEIGAPGMLCDIVALIASAGWRGELVVWSTIGQSESAARSIFFETGNVLGAQSTAPGERLGEIMYKLGALDREQILAISKKTTPERRFGETAVDLGFLPRERLFDLVRTQTEEIVFSALRTGEGTFWFVDGFDPSRLAYQHRVSAQVLLMEGVRRLDEGKYFTERIPSAAHVPVKLPIRVEPPADLAKVFAACDGKRSVAEVGRVCGLSEFDTTHTLFRLAQGGFVQIDPPRPNHPDGIVEIFNGAIRAILKAADEDGRGPRVREHLGAFASTTGVYDALFLGAGPASDGSIDPARVSRNLAPLAGDEPVAALSKWLHDYLSFALFDATTEMPKDRARRLNDELSDHIARLAPKNGPISVVPPALPPLPSSAPKSRSGPPPLPRPQPAFADDPPKPPAVNLPALQPMSTPAPETRPSVDNIRPLPKATQMQLVQPPAPTPPPPPPLPPLPPIFDDPTRDPMPSPMFQTAPIDAASDLANSKRLERRRTTRTVLLILACLLLAGAAAASLVVLDIVKIPGLSTAEPTPEPTPTPRPRPRPTPSAEPSPTVPASPSPSPSPSPEPAPTTATTPSTAATAPPPSDIPQTQGRLVLKAPAGFRVWVDNKVVGETPTPVLVACGPRAVKVGSHGSEQKLVVPCGGELEVYAK